MTGGSGYPGRPAHAAGSGRRPARRIGWGAASRRVDGENGRRGGNGENGGRGGNGENGGRGAGNLDTLLAIAAAPPSEATLDPAQLEPILMAFRGAGIGANPTPQPRRVIRQRSSRAALVKCAAVFLVVGGSGVAAASAGVLPSSMQQIAHEYFGGVGIPAPAASGTAGVIPSTAPGTAGSPSPAPSPGEATAGSTAQLMPLCQTVAENPQQWRSVLDTADQAALVAAAGAPGHVGQYCAALLATSSSSAVSGNQGVTPSPAQPTEPSSRATPGASATHGNAHPSHSPSPNPHSTGH